MICWRSVRAGFCRALAVGLKLRAYGVPMEAARWAPGFRGSVAALWNGLAT